MLASLGWVFANIATKNVLQFVRTVVLWRILSEDDFGLNGMAWLAINGMSLLQDMGFQNALVHRRTDIEKATSVTWYANVAIRLAVYGILLAAAPAVAAYFEEPEVGPILRVAGLAIVIGAFGSANRAVLRRSFQFRRILVVDTLEVFALVASQIALALLGFGVWSLVYGTLISTTSRALMLWRIAPIRLVKFDVQVAKEMFHFGKHMTVSTLLLWLIGNLDYLFIGKFLGTGALGFYTLAFRLAYLIAQNVARMLGAVLFPAFSEIGHDLARARSAWLRSIRYSMVLMMPMGLGMILFSQEFIATFYKPKLAIVVLPMAILTVSALVRGVGVPLGDLQKGIGKPHLLTIVALVHLVVLAPLLATVTIGARPLYGWCIDALPLLEVEKAVVAVLLEPFVVHGGLIAASVVISGSTVVAGLGTALWLTSKVVGYTPYDVVVAVRPSLVAGGAMIAVVLIAKGLAAVLVPGLPPAVRLFTLGPISLAVYGLVLWLGFPAVIAHIRDAVRKKRVRGVPGSTIPAESGPHPARPAAE